MFIETICIKNGRVQNIQYHNQRFNRTRKTIYGIDNSINLRNYINPPSGINSRLIKCRITYQENILDVTYDSYKIRPIFKIKLIYSNHISYTYKSSNRNELDMAYSHRGDADDIIIVKEGILTDTYYGNIALLRDQKWFTPLDPLLKGTRRSKLIAKGLISPKRLSVEDLGLYEKISVFNSMIPFKKLIIGTDCVIY